MSDKVYASGLFAKKPNPKAPKFVIGTLSFKVADFVFFLKEHENEKGYVNVQLLDGKDDRLNAVLDTWKPDPNKQSKPKEATHPKPDETPKPSQESDNDDPF